MRNKVLLISLAGGVGSRLWPLTLSLPKPLMLFGPTGRLIDIGLSAALEAHIRNAYVLTQFQANRLNEYVYGWQRFCNLEMGEWIKPFSPTHAQDFFQTDAHSLVRLWQEHSSEILQFDTVIVAMSDQVYSIDYSHMLNGFLRAQADVQIAYVPVSKTRALNSFGVLSLDSSGKVSAIQEKPSRIEDIPSLNSSEPDMCPANIALYSIRVDAFKEMVSYLESQSNPSLTLSRSGIPFLLERYMCCSYDTRTSIVRGSAEQQTGIFEDLGTLTEFYDYSMKLTQPGGIHYNLRNNWFPLHSGNTAPPVELIVDNANIRHSLLGPGVILQGSAGQGVSLANSIIGMNVMVCSGANIKNSIMFANSKIGQNANLENCIIGENVTVPNGLVLSPQSYPTATQSHEDYLGRFGAIANPQEIPSIPVLVDGRILVIPNNYIL